MAQLMPVMADYLSEIARAKHVWGQNDCMMFPANWIRDCYGVDPAAPWRGTYDNLAGAARILLRENGLINLMGKGMEAAGLVPTANPGMGAVGVVRYLSGTSLHRSGAVKTAHGWATVTTTDLIVWKSLEAQAAWEWPCPR